MKRSCENRRNYLHRRPKFPFESVAGKKGRDRPNPAISGQMFGKYGEVQLTVDFQEKIQSKKIPARARGNKSFCQTGNCNATN